MSNFNLGTDVTAGVTFARFRKTKFCNFILINKICRLKHKKSFDIFFKSNIMELFLFGKNAAVCDRVNVVHALQHHC